VSVFHWSNGWQDAGVVMSVWKPGAGTLVPINWRIGERTADRIHR
jgi:hypothetical protein